MKKLFIGILFLLAAVLACLLFTDAGLPRTELLEPVSAPDGSGGVWLLENRAWSSRLYRADEGGRISEAYVERRRNGDKINAFIQAAANSRGVYFIRETYPEGSLSAQAWTLCHLRPGAGAPEVLGGGQVCSMRVTGLALDGDRVLVAGVTDKNSAALCALDTAGDGWTLKTVQGTNVLSASADEKGLTALLSDGQRVRFSGAVPVSAPEEKSKALPQGLTVTARVRFLCKGDLLLTAGAGAALVLLVLLLAWQGSRAKSLALRTTLVAGGCLFLSLVCVAVGLTAGGSDLQARWALDYSASLTRARALLIGRYDSAALLRADYFGSAQAANTRQLLSAGDEVIALRPTGPSIVLSGRFPYGAAAEDVLTGEELALLDAAAQGERGQLLTYRSGRRLALCAYAVYAGGIPVGVLLSRATAEVSYEMLLAFVSLVGLVLAVMFLLTLFLLYCFLRATTRPVRTLTGQMKAVGDGDLSVHPLPDRRDELGEMAQTMQEMCMSLSIRDYEVNEVLRSYGRFIPKKLEKLLDRASVMEVSFGDARTLSGSVGILSVSNREDARARLADADYVNFVSDCFSTVSRMAETHGGRLLSTAFDLAAVPVLYGGGADALQSGLDLLGEMRRRADSGHLAPDFFQLLHHASFLYGIAGTREQVFPFLSSSELEFLGSYAGKFRSAGVRLAVTEPFRKELRGGYNMRYLGFVASGDGRFSFKLYESLDAFPDLERNLRIRYDQRFQEAIRLFYHDDFYLARNIFSALLKTCPEDGVARWYLFACERYFNSMGQEHPDYGLFSLE